MKIFDENGTAKTGDIEISTYYKNNLYAEDITQLNNGNIVVVFRSNSYENNLGFEMDKSGVGVYGQEFDKEGTKIGQNFCVNIEYTSSTQLYGSVDSIGDSSFVVVWASSGQAPDSSNYGIFGKVYNGKTKGMSDQFLINTKTSDQQNHPKVRSLGDDSFVVVWDSHNQDGSSWGVYAQRYELDFGTVDTDSDGVLDPIDDFPKDPALSEVPTFNMNLPVTENVFLWLDAQQAHGSKSVTNNSKLMSWIDLSGNENHAVQEDEDKQPLYVQDTQNSKPVIKFTGDVLSLGTELEIRDKMSLYLIPFL
jgi:hypothetical protein